MTVQTADGKQKTTKLECIGKRAVHRKETVFNNIGYGLDLDLLHECYQELDGKKAIGIDGVTKERYGRRLEDNLQAWYSYKSYYRCWSNCIKKARITTNPTQQPVRFRSPKNTRHTYASTLSSRGENLLWVSMQMGHADTRITQKSYVRWLPDKSTLAGYRPVHDWQAYCSSGVLSKSI